MMTDQSTGAAEIQKANLYQLKGQNTQISYQTTGIAGQPQLTYVDDRGSRTFTGDELRSLDSEIGGIVSVTLELSPDSQIVTLSLLIPSIKLEGQSTDFQTVAIVTTKRSGFLAVRPGQLETYTTMPLTGTASLVEF